MNLPPEYEESVFIKEPMTDPEVEWSKSNDNQFITTEEVRESLEEAD